SPDSPTTCHNPTHRESPGSPLRRGRSSIRRPPVHAACRPRGIPPRDHSPAVPLLRPMPAGAPDRCPPYSLLSHATHVERATDAAVVPSNRARLVRLADQWKVTPHTLWHGSGPIACDGAQLG